MARSLADFVREALKTVEEISAESAAQILEKPDRAGWDFIDGGNPTSSQKGTFQALGISHAAFSKCAPTSSTPNATRGSKIEGAR